MQLTLSDTLQGVVFYCLFKTKHRIITRLVAAPAATVFNYLLYEVKDITGRKRGKFDTIGLVLSYNWPKDIIIILIGQSNDCAVTYQSSFTYCKGLLSKHKLESNSVCSATVYLVPSFLLPLSLITS